MILKTKTKLLALLLLTTMLVVGCSDSSSYSQAGEIITLKVGEEVEVFQSDEIEPANDETQISVRHLLSADKKYVTLLSGSATLVRGENVVISE